MVADPKSDHHKDKRAVDDADLYTMASTFIVPPAARWETLAKKAAQSDVKKRVDDALELLEKTYPDELRGLLQRIYAGSNMDAEDLRQLVTLFSRETFRRDHGGEDLIGRVYEYFIGEFASSDGKRGGLALGPALRRHAGSVLALAPLEEPRREGRLPQAEGRGAAHRRPQARRAHSRLAQAEAEGTSWRDVIDEVAFLQALRRQVLKTVRSATKLPASLEQRVRGLVDAAVEAEGMVDIYAAAGLERPDLSIIDDAFLQTFKNRPRPDLRAKLLSRLLEDELDRVERQNLTKARSFRELLKKTLDDYHSRVIDAAMVVQRIAEMHRELEGDARRAKLLGLAEDEVAFYDAVAGLAPDVYDEPYLCEVIHEVVQAVKRNIRPEWTQPHRSDVRAAVRVAVRMVLRKRQVRDQDREAFSERLLQQAEARFAAWPLAA
jgi:hypothetical protein